ncbi:50S ribosomal protein L4 [Rickettsia endosymbiont of Cardiosporidium cionae]|uniref:50S ribosomal protein L4 n=1 Tax=Rickettsia endosymbiont of Cardiosporidium cionae TaxID=2777155 RepID=UPI0018947C0D|nr:50S ribosomal protein L4 [Rickettsia endosymbiont of Cardiosporidium cionae]KAF8818201.1 50S ribosomal protein L4 [Rickettsia endosymbiont of Cardiosporidium cionae]
MKVDLLDLNNQVLQEISVNQNIFGLDVRYDLIKFVIDWQLAKRRSGSHKVKNSSEVSGSTKKPFKQKGTGNARQGNARSPILRGGGVAHGPVVRSHVIGIQKKVKLLGLKHALSLVSQEKALYIIDSFKDLDIKTKSLLKTLNTFGKGNFFIIHSGIDEDANLKYSARSLAGVSIAPVLGVNVYDIVNNDYILLSKDALHILEKRLG